jgi:lipid II:glycine glycyltransferase (peptidoglycan interpeptide bridge formation enzyme)
MRTSMNTILTRPVTNKTEWEKFLSLHPEANFLQSWDWGDFHKNLGKKIFRTGFYKDTALVGIMLSVVEPARRGRYLTVPGGPIIDWKDERILSEIFSTMRQIAKEQRCVFVRIRPQLIDDEFSRNIFSKYGSKDAPMHLHAELTSQLDITKSTDELLAQMRKTTRYEIKKAQKLGIQVETSIDEKKMKIFYDLQIETAKRQKFVPFSYTFLDEQFKVFAKAHEAVLYTAIHEGQILAQAFIIFYGSEAVYHYGASTEEGRKYPGAYLIQWEAIQEAKRRGMKRYNFWGVAAETEKNHRFYGISIFKRGFAGEDVQYLHAQDLVIDRTRYFFNLLVERVRKITRRV